MSIISGKSGLRLILVWAIPEIRVQGVKKFLRCNDRIIKIFCHFFKLNARIQNPILEICYDKQVQSYVTCKLNLVHH